MSRFIATVIKRAADVSLEKGQEKYRAYFTNTSLYLNWKSEVDTMLEADGYLAVLE